MASLINAPSARQELRDILDYIARDKPTGDPGEVFLKIGKQGSTLSGLMQAWAVTVSAALQRGVPWAELREKYIDTKFAPNDHRCTSLVDAVARTIDDLTCELREKLDDLHGQLRLEFQSTQDAVQQ